VLAYSPRQRTFAVGNATVLLSALSAMVVALPMRTPGDLWAFFGLMVMSTLLTAPLLLEFYKVSFSYDDAGITVHSPWSRTPTLLWSEVQRVRWQRVMKWLDLRDARGTVVVRLSVGLVGLEGFARTCREHIAAAILDADADAAAVITLMERGQAGHLAAKVCVRHGVGTRSCQCRLRRDLR
jgi:hypothetical protein